MKYVDLEDLVCYIECYSKTYFDRKTYKLYYKRELTLLSRISKIKLPKISVMKIIKAYLKNHPEILDEIDGKLTVSSFHRTVTDYGMYDDWGDFRWDYLCDFAAEWCKAMGIRYEDKRES